MAADVTATCDVVQGYSYTPATRRTFGYLTSLAVGGTELAADIGRNGVGTAGQDVSGPRNPLTGTTQAVVGVLSAVSWPTTPTGPITVGARISVANAQQVPVLAPAGAPRTTVRLGLVVFDWAPTSSSWITTFQSWKGVPPTGSSPAAPDAWKIPAVFGVLGRGALRVGATPENEPDGIKNYTLDLTVAPPVAASAQLISLRPLSASRATILPFGLPQS